MGRSITVGRGFGKHTFAEAMDMTRAGDTILLEPGHYSEPRGYRVANVRMRGLGEQPSDVVLETRFQVVESGTLNLENLTMDSHAMTGNTCYITAQCTLIARGVIFETSQAWPTLAVTGGTIGLTACTVLQSDPQQNAVYSDKTSTLIISQCDIDDISVAKSKLTLQMTQVRRCLMIIDNSEVDADTLYLVNTNPRIFTFAVRTGSVFRADKLVVAEGHANAEVKDSSAVLKAANVDATHLITISQDEGSTVQVPGAIVQVDKKATSTTDGAPAKPAPSKADPQPDAPEAKDKTQDGTQTPLKTRMPAALTQLDAMIGLTQVKTEVHQFIQLAVFNRRRIEKGLPGVTQSLHSLFLGNPGTGKTTVARLVGKIMFQERVLPKDNYVEVGRADLVAENIGGTALKTKAVLDSALGGVLFIDEAYTLYQQGSTNWGQEAVDTIMQYMEDHRNELMIIFAGYTQPMQDFINMNPGIRSRTPNVFHFTDYTPAEVATIGLKQIAGKEFKVDPDYYRATVVKAYAADVDHSNGRWIRNFNDKLLRVVANNVMADPKRDDSTILKTDIDDLLGGDAQAKADTVTALLKQLDDLVGQQTVKNAIHDLVDQVRVTQKVGDKLDDNDKPTYHMVFAGDPGTGKTTVARILAKLFYNLGVLPKDTVIEVARPQLIGRYIGETEEKTSKAIRDALGGVLFVDEAYQLVTENDNQDFGQKAVETFITELENHRQDFVAIFAGYTQPMQHFLDANPGLRSRVPYTLEFQPYTPDEVAEIVNRLITRHLHVNSALLKKVVAAHYQQIPAKEQANGRWARTFAEKLVQQHKLWLVDHLDTDDVKQIQDGTVVASLSWDI
ncbi:AAA family ATPase [Schleiferilactobacillus shenzhenensis]|uniref:CfxQ n=1 Tax=Schleiferilactobacillus shenzhenensis LY-73 TaxID=1231336 RepID=U4TP02_9LACO|nr:AAA family ATPase [Schleiferilactobacillus shenzhenensis]ERL65175.1 CfxQ [Schleiferilactobacillus shenzhenensis LY-73]